MRIIEYDSEGKLFVGNGEDDTPLADQVKVQVAGLGLNRADLLQKQGLYPPPAGESAVLGLEVSGTVVAVGSHVQHLQVGDEVMGLLAGGGYSEFVTDHAGLFFPIPKDIGLVDAAAIPEVFLTGYQVLGKLAKVQKGETLLIHAGASGLGSAAIQYAKYKECQVIITAGSDEKVEFCLRLGADIGINYNTEDFEERVNNAGGADVVLDVVGGDYFPKNIKVLKPDGRYLVVAFMGGRRGSIDLSQVLAKRIQLIGTTLRARSIDYKSALIQDFISECMEGFHTGLLRPCVDKVFTIEEANEAHAYMAANENMGKLLLRWS